MFFNHPVIFLDFDGVLHPFQRDAYFTKLALFQDILRANPGVEVVFSTSWRKTNDLDKLIDHMTCISGIELANRFIGCTPVMNPEKYNRMDECLAWLKKNGKNRNWLAIDDNPHLFEPGYRYPHNVYICDSNTGLVENDVDRINNMLLLLKRQA